MTKLQMNKVHDLVLTLIQREVNGHPYVTITKEETNYCGGYRLVISDVPLLHDNDILAIIGVCVNCCVQFQLCLNEKQIVLI